MQKTRMPKKRTAAFRQQFWHFKFIAELFSIHCNDLFFIIASASLAYSVRHHQSTAFAALYKCRSCHFPAGSVLISSCFGMLILRTD